MWRPWPPDGFHVTTLLIKHLQRGSRIEEPGGDWSELGAGQTLFENWRDSVTVSVRDGPSLTIGALIEPFVREVGFCASLINVNAYYQSDVESVRNYYETVRTIYSEVLDFLAPRRGNSMNWEGITKCISAPDEIEHIFENCQRLSMAPPSIVSEVDASDSFIAEYQFI